ncbi:hypothetical protein OAQ37_06385 [Alphaproteobacteria bacterium]|nr:hypothetical protein [Alphaproteobacteria bacterium]
MREGSRVDQNQRKIHSRWFFKPIEMLQTNLATIDENQDGRILFVVETGWIFDELSYPDNETAERKLRLNGFKRCDEDPAFETLSFIPDNLHEGTPNPVYSSGKHWRE